MNENKVSILFVCSGNTCRSPMAEGIARKLLGIDAHSAGTNVTETNATQDAMDVLLAVYQVDISAHHATPVDQLSLGQFDYIVAMGENNGIFLRQNFPDLESRLKIWNIPDPYGQGYAVYHETAAAIERETRLLAEELGLPLSE